MKVPQVLHARSRSAMEWLVSAVPTYVYGAAAGFAALPACASVFLGLHQARDGFDGYFTHSNWYSLIAILPMAIWLLRKIEHVLSPANTDGPVVQVFGEEDRLEARRELATIARSGTNLMIAAAVMSVLHAYDMSDVLSTYWGRWQSAEAVVAPQERDWSVMFLAGTAGFPGRPVIGIVPNFAFVLAAYAVQFAVGIVALLALILLSRHNIFFITHIFQRRWAASRPNGRYIRIDLNDPDCLFGFAPARTAFNLQVGITAIAGVLLLASRFRNTPPDKLKALYELEINLGELGKTFQKLLQAVSLQDTLGDAGQRILIALWLIMISIVSIPAVVKFLPVFWIQGLNLTTRMYLKEFLPDESWPGDSRIDEVKKAFARNAFWPTGDGRARFYFTAAFFVFLLLLYPVRPTGDRVGAALVLYGLFVALAYAATAVAFWVFNTCLSFFGDDLGKSKTD